MLFWNGTRNIEVDNIDVLSNLSQDVANNIAIGPQEDFLIMLKRINEQLFFNNIGNIGITKKWNWKPGSYDKMKELISKKLDLHKKSNGMDNLLYRTYDRVNYLSHIKSQALEMERQRYKLKDLGVSPDVDLNVFKEQCNEFVNSMLSQSETITKMFNNKVELNTFIKIDEENNYKADLYIDMHLFDLTLNVFQGKDKLAKSIQELPLQPIHIIVQCDFRKLLNNMNIKPLFRGKYVTGEESSSRRKQITFPYIGNSDDNSYGAVCLDNYLDEAYNSIKNKDMISLVMTLLSWSQYYNITFANPYSQPHYLFLGIPEGLTKEYVNTISRDDIMYSCPSRVVRLNNSKSRRKNRLLIESSSGFVDICNNAKCTLRDECLTYKSHAEKLSKYNNEEWLYKAESLAGWLLEQYIDKSYEWRTDSTLTMRANYILDRNADLVSYTISLDNYSLIDDNGHIIGTGEEGYFSLYCQLILDSIIEYMAGYRDGLNFMRHLEDYGYHYWLKEDNVKIENTDSERQEEELKELMKQWATSSERSEF